MESKRSTVVTIVILILVLCLALGAVWWIKERNQLESLRTSTAGVALGTPENVAQYTDLDGQSLSLDAYVGTVLIVHSWASWCPQCTKDLKTLDRVARQFNSDAVTVLAINRAEPAATAERYLRTVVGQDTTIELVLDPDDYFYHSIDAYAMPETVIFTNKGVEVARYRTPLSDDELVSVLNGVVGE